MSSQLLVNIITCPWLEPSAPVQVPHGLRSNGRPLKPRSVMPEKGTSIIVTDVDETYVHFLNAGVSGDEARFRVEHGHSFEVGGEEIAPFLWKGSFGDGTGTVQHIQTGDGLQGGPITGAGTISMRPLTPSPAGTYGSGTAVPVMTVNNKGQVTSVSTQPISGSGVTGLNVTAPITKGGTASTPIIGITLGNTASSACAGNDARLSDQRVPTDGSVTDTKVAAANKDGLAAVPSMRTLGTGAQQACAGDDARLGGRTVYNMAFFLVGGAPKAGDLAYVPAFPVEYSFPGIAVNEPVNRRALIDLQISGYIKSNYTAPYVKVESVRLSLEALSGLTSAWEELAGKDIYLDNDIPDFTVATSIAQLPDISRTYRVYAGPVHYTGLRIRLIPSAVIDSSFYSYYIKSAHLHWTWWY